MIPEAAVEAAFESLFGADPRMKDFKWTMWLPTINSILEAAEPHMTREAKRDSWDEGWQKAHSTEDPAMAGIFFNPYRSKP